MRLLLDFPDLNLDALKLVFMDITKRAVPMPVQSSHPTANLQDSGQGYAENIDLVCIPTTSGTGSEVVCL